MCRSEYCSDFLKQELTAKDLEDKSTFLSFIEFGWDPAMKVYAVLATLIAVGAVALLVMSKFNESKKNNQNSDRSENQQVKDLELVQTRNTVRMLDDIYKGGIVKITDQYVNKKTTIPAGTAFKQIFAIAKEKGWHEVRLLDATGDPYNDENVANDEFEKRAIKKIVTGAAYYEEIEKVGQERYLRAMTAIPVALEKCTMCHSEYENAKPGQAIGALGYRIKIKEFSELDQSKE